MSLEDVIRERSPDFICPTCCYEDAREQEHKARYVSNPLRKTRTVILVIPQRRKSSTSSYSRSTASLTVLSSLPNHSFDVIGESITAEKKANISHKSREVKKARMVLNGNFAPQYIMPNKQESRRLDTKAAPFRKDCKRPDAVP
jgi:hypothetical protein